MTVSIRGMIETAYDLHVDAGRVDSSSYYIYRASDGTPQVTPRETPPDESPLPYTVDGLFDQVSQVISMPTNERDWGNGVIVLVYYRVTFDPVLGYPKVISSNEIYKDNRWVVNDSDVATVVDNLTVLRRSGPAVTTSTPSR